MIGPSAAKIKEHHEWLKACRSTYEFDWTVAMTDRDKLAREMMLAWCGTFAPEWEKLTDKSREDWRRSADIALAYAEKRVAEAVERAAQAAYFAIGPQHQLAHIVRNGIRVLSPARDGGGDE